VAVLDIIGVTKRFGSLLANDSISLSLDEGEILALLGENGAGKTTLMNILFGHYVADEGHILAHGEPLPPGSPDAAIAAGIGMVHQHFMLVYPFTVLENVILGVEGGALLGAGIADAHRELERLERDYELQVDPGAIVGELPVGLQQRVEILKALYRGAEILILDEPTSVLTPAEADHLFAVLKQLRDQGKTIILITHSVEEALLLGERLLVMAPRPGRIHKEYNLPFAEMGVGADLREVKKHTQYDETREEILNMIWDMEEEIMGRTEDAA